jgi:ABC-type transport system involved in multi-copper enzyme maturation permease subunit
MTTTALSHHNELRATRGPSRTVPFTRLATVETRKLTDTRTAIALLVLLALGGVVAMVGHAVFLPPDVQDVATGSAFALGVFLPVLGIVTVTSEWSKGTALTTFALEPRRWRVLAAKVVAGVTLALAVSALMIALAFPVTAAVAAAEGGAATFTIDPAALAGWTVTNVLFALCGIALGSMLLGAAASIVVYFAASIVWSFVGISSELGSDLAHWLDLGSTVTPLSNGELGADAVGPLLASIGVWIALPLLLGLIRTSRIELR